MALYYRDPARRPSRLGYAYLAVLLAALVIVAGAYTIWLTTDTSGTNMLATDPQSTSPPGQPAP
jgi:hypothetical protein